MSMLNYIVRSLFLSVIILLSTANSFAQEEPDTIAARQELGEVVIKANVVSNREQVDIEQIEMYQKANISDALNLLPGTINVKGGKTDMVYVHGFDQRQVQLYYDGVPIYIPYDGYLDLAMLMSSDIGKISVSSGTESLLYGPNALGGAINVVTTKPKKGFSLMAKAGTFTNGKYNASLSAGYANAKYYVKAAYSVLDKENYNLSKDYKQVVSIEDGGDLDNSFRKMSQFSAKVGFTPKEAHEYAFSYVKHNGERGITPYLGTNGTSRYWRFPVYDKESFYFLSNSKLTSNLLLKSRLYYDKLDNSLVSYDDTTYTSQERGYSFTSFYDDYSFGGIATLSYNTEINKLVLDIQYKYDNHKEHDVGLPVAEMTDQNTSISLIDYYDFSNFSVNGGISINYMESLKAEYLDENSDVAEHPDNKTTTYNGEIGCTYHFDDSNFLKAGISHKTRFPTMKDRYSLRFGRSIANPDLNEEYAINYTLDYSVTILNNKLHFEAGGFYSSLKDAIVSVYGVVEDDPNIYQLQNTGEAEYFGADISVAYQLFKPLSLRANYSYIERNNISSPDVKFTGVPNHTLQASVTYFFENHSYININCESYSDRYSTSDGIKVDGYTIFNAKGSFTVYKDVVKLEAGILNILDKDYQIQEGYPMQGRNLFASLVFTL